MKPLNNKYSDVELEEVVDDLLKKYLDLHMEKIKDHEKQYFETNL